MGENLETRLEVITDVARLSEQEMGSSTIKLLRVGAFSTSAAGWPLVETREDPLVETIVGYAHEVGAGLIAMPTAGRRGLFDAPGELSVD